MCLWVSPIYFWQSYFNYWRAKRLNKESVQGVCFIKAMIQRFQEKSFLLRLCFIAGLSNIWCILTSKKSFDRNQTIYSSFWISALHGVFTSDAAKLKSDGRFKIVDFPPSSIWEWTHARSTRSFQAVSPAITLLGRCCLTSVFKWNLVFSMWLSHWQTFFLLMSFDALSRSFAVLLWIFQVSLRWCDWVLNHLNILTGHAAWTHNWLTRNLNICQS